MGSASSQLGSRFWTLWSALTASNLGDGLTLVAFPLLAVDLTDDARLISLVTVFRFLPFLVVGLPAGLIIDRFDRRLLAMGAQFGRAAATGLLAVAVASGSASIAVAAAVAFAIGVGEVLVDGGLPAVVRNVVEHRQLEVANSRLSATQTVTNMFIGPPLGAVLYSIDPALAVGVAAALYLVTIGFLGRLTGSFRAAREDDTGEPLRRRMAVGLRYVWSHPVLRPLALTVGLFSFVGSAGNAIHVLLVTERFGLGDLGFGLALATDGVASVVMSFFVAGVVSRRGHSFSLRVGIVGFVVSALFYSTTTFVPAVFLGAVFGGISDPSWNVVSGTLRQRLVPDEIFGRMMTAYLFIAWSMQPLGGFLGGVIAEQWGPHWVYVLSGTTVASLLVLARPLFRAVDTAMGVPAHDGGEGGG